MSHRRARKNAKKAAGESTKTITFIDSHLDGVELTNLPSAILMGPSMRKFNRSNRKAARHGGAGITKVHPIASKPKRKAANKAARASRRVNH